MPESEPAPDASAAPHAVGWRWLLLVVALAAGLRLWHLAELSQRWPLFGHVYGDSTFYLAIGEQLGGGAPFFSDQGQAYVQAPGYGYLCGAALGLRGALGLGSSRVGLILGLQLLGGVLGVVALTLLAARWLGVIGGRVTGLAAATYGPWILYDAELLPLSSLLTMTALAWLAADHLLETRARPALQLLGWAALGGWLGLASLVRMNLLPFALALIGWGAIRRWRDGRLRALTAAGLALLCFAAPLVPAAGRNAVICGRWQIVFSGQQNVWLANNPNWRETSTARAGRVWTELFRAPGVHPDADPIAFDAWYGRQALAWVRADPGAFLAGLVAKAWLWIGGHERARSVDPYDHARRSRALRTLIWHRGLAFPFGLLLPLGAIGAWLAARDPRRRRRMMPLLLFIGCYAASLALFIPAARYRVPIAVALLPFAALAGLELWRGRRVALALIALAAALLLSLDNPPTEPAYLAEIQLLRGDRLVSQLSGLGPDERAAAIAAAARAYREALRLWPEGSHPHARLGDLARLAGQPGSAERHYGRAMEANPFDWVAPYQRAQLREQRDDHAGALADYRQSAEARPDLAFLHEAVARLELAAGNLTAARDAARRALERDPTRAEAQRIHRTAR